MASKMGTSYFLLLTTYLALLGTVTQGELSITNFGYEDVVVTISPDVPETNGQEIIDGIKVGAQLKKEIHGHKHPCFSSH